HHHRPRDARRGADGLRAPRAGNRRQTVQRRVRSVSRCERPGEMIGAIVFDGVAYGSLLFLISAGLSVTMGLMNFVHLAPGAFAMFGGYLCVSLTARFGIPFLATLPFVFVALGLAGAVVERLVYRRLYRADQLDQVLLTIGLVFVCMAVATYAF